MAAVWPYAGAIVLGLGLDFAVLQSAAPLPMSPLASAEAFPSPTPIPTSTVTAVAATTASPTAEPATSTPTAAPTAPPTVAATLAPRTAAPATAAPTPAGTVRLSVRLTNGTQVVYSGPGAVTQGATFTAIFSVVLLDGRGGNENLSIYLGDPNTPGGSTTALASQPDANGNYVVPLRANVPRGAQRLSVIYGTTAGIFTLGTITVQ